MATTGRSWMTTATLSVSTSIAGWAAAGSGATLTPSVFTTAIELTASGGHAEPPMSAASLAANVPASCSASATPVVARASVHQYGTGGGTAPSSRSASPSTETSSGASTETRGRPSRSQSCTTAPSPRVPASLSGPPESRPASTAQGSGMRG